MNELINLFSILLNINNYKWSDALYLSENEIWSENTKGAIMDPDDVEFEEDEVPKFAMDNNLSYILDIGSIQDIVRNAFLQKDDCSVNDLFEAFKYYYKNDAFIVFEQRES